MFLDKLHSPLQFYNKNTSSTIVYDQGANRLRKFILVELGASLFLIELLFNWKYICLYVYDTLGTMQEYLLQKLI